MANPMKGEAVLRVGEAEHKLLINWGVLIQVERECGLPLLLPNLWQHIGFLVSLLRHAIKAAGGKQISDIEAADIMAKAPDALSVLHDAYLAIMPQAEPGDETSAEGKA